MPKRAIPWERTFGAQTNDLVNHHVWLTLMSLMPPTDLVAGHGGVGELAHLLEEERLQRQGSYESLEPQLKAALEALRQHSPAQYEAVVLQRLGHFSQVELARKLGVSQSAVAKRIQRGYEFLNSFLTGTQEDGPPTIDSLAEELEQSPSQLLETLNRVLSDGDKARMLGVPPETLEWALTVARADPDLLRAVRNRVVHDNGLLPEEIAAPQAAEGEQDDGKTRHSGELGILLAPRKTGQWTVSLQLWDVSSDGELQDFLLIEGGEQHTFADEEAALVYIRDLMTWPGDVIGYYVEDPQAPSQRQFAFGTAT
jgi:Sigma-70, region 4